MNKIKLSWKEVGVLIEQLATQVKESGEVFDGIYGVPRGGLPIAIALSHRLNLPLLIYPTENTLVVDDISDTGRTLASHKNKKIAVIHNTNWTITKPDYFVSRKRESNDWIVYPWEEDEK